MIDTFDVVCIEDGKTTQLIKGATYKCTRVDVWSYSSIGWNISIKGLNGPFNIDFFSLPDGTPVPRVKFISNFREEESIYNILNNEIIGRRVKCITKDRKTLVYGKIYHVEEVSSYSTSYIKIKENGKTYSKSNFELLKKEENRYLEIESLLGDNEILKRLTTYDSIEISDFEKIISMLNIIIDAIRYKKQTEVSLSLYEIMSNRPKFNQNEIKKEDFKKLSDIDWLEFINNH